MFGVSPGPTQLAIATVVYDMVRDLVPGKVPDFMAGNGIVKIKWDYLLDKIDNPWVFCQSVVFFDGYCRVSGGVSFEYADPGFPQNLLDVLGGGI